jgi:hydroxymethylpyrimidine pyrophosphatase-like HAD family hydrolase
MNDVTRADRALDAALAGFLAAAPFAARGAVMTDLDGTAVHERMGRVAIPKSVSHALTELRRLGRPIVLNTLRFPLNVIRTFGREWYAISNAPLPLVSLNGSVIGYLREGSGAAIDFEELCATPLPASTCEAVLVDVERLLAAGIEDVVLFHYPRDWRLGERLWVPVVARSESLLGRYPSASEVTSGPLERLSATLSTCEPCMLLLLVNASHDRLMAYQHARPNQFVTADGVDKAAGAHRAANLLGFDLDASVGAGDTAMDTFLSTVGLALRVGAPGLPFTGRHATLDVVDSLALGELWFRLADQLRRSTQ